jgi:hypothetical protein
MQADVVLLDIIRYTLLPNEKQYQVLYYLNRIIGTISALLEVRPVLRGESVIRGAIPNGDGCFLILHPRIAGYGPLMALFLRNFLLLNNRMLDQLFNGVRVSVNHGPIIPVQFLETQNFVGDGLNVCARLHGRAVQNRASAFYSGADDFVVVTRAAWERFEALFPPENPDVEAYLKKIRFTHSAEFPIRDKHSGRPAHRVRFIDCARVIGSAPPQPKARIAS